MSTERKLVESDRLKRKGFEAGEEVLQTDGPEIDDDQLFASLRSGNDSPVVLKVPFVNSNVTLSIYVDSVTKYLVPHERSDALKPPGNDNVPSWCFQGWMVEFKPEPVIVRMRGYLDPTHLQVQRVPEKPDPDGLIIVVED